MVASFLSQVAFSISKLKPGGPPGLIWLGITLVQKILQKFFKSSAQTLRKYEEATAILLTLLYTSEIVILAASFQLKQLKKQPEKNSGLNGNQTHDLAIPVFHSCLSAVHIYEFHIFIFIFTVHCYAFYSTHFLQQDRYQVV